MIAEMPGNDPDDREHMAAAIAGGANAIITRDRGDFPSEALAHWGIRVLDPDEYLSELLVELPHEVVETVVRMAAGKKRPPLSPGALADALAKAGVPSFAAELREHLDS